jgi:transitional endoplasmic reticulum ATPase
MSDIPSSDPFHNNPDNSPDSADDDNSGGPQNAPLAEEFTELELEGIDGESLFNWQPPENAHLSIDHIKGYPYIRDTLDRLVVDPVSADHNYYEMFKVRAPDMLFVGPPGTGKTHAAKALIGELDVPYVILAPSTVKSQFVNRSGRLINRLFIEAGEIARCREESVIIFLDEIDAVLPSRTSTRNMHHEGHKVVNEFLTELERTEERNIIFIGATNRPDRLDTAAIRPGRINRTIQFEEPDGEARVEILRYYLTDQPCSVGRTELNKIARDRCNGLYPSGIKSVAETAARRAASLRSEAIRPDHIKTAAKQVTAEVARSGRATHEQY